jgi:hypothetical protein
VPTPIVYRNTLFALKEGGILSSLDPRTGDVHNRGRLEAAPQPLTAPGRTEAGRTYRDRR